MFASSRLHVHGNAPSTRSPLSFNTDSALPAYSNNISLTALLPRKVEMVNGQPAKDRSWKSVWCCVEGTSLSIYKDNRSLQSRMRVKSQVAPSASSRVKSLDPRALGYAPSYNGLMEQFAPQGEKHRSLSLSPSSRESSLSPMYSSHNSPYRNSARSPLSAMSGSTPVLPTPMGHRFPLPSTVDGLLASPMDPRASTTGSPMLLGSPMMHSPFDEPSSRRVSTVSMLYPSPSPAVLEPPPLKASSPQRVGRQINQEFLIRQYSLNGAQCGLASDYEKRAHVLRLRIDGEQFLLQLPDLQTNVQWIETIQTAMELSLDLDQRSMPRHEAFPGSAY